MIGNRNFKAGNEALEGRFDALMASYRDALPDRDASPDFMPEMWARIDARRKSAFAESRSHDPPSDLV